MEITKVTVLGAGNAGFTIAFHLSNRGFKVALFEHPDFKQAIEPIINAGEIKALPEANGFKAVISGTGPVTLATSDIKSAVEFGDVIIIIVPAFGQGPMFKSALPYLKDSQIIMSMPGNFASLLYAQIVKEEGVTKSLYFVDTDSIPYACRKVKDNQVFISGIKSMLNTGVYPACSTTQILAKLQPLFTLKLEPTVNVIEAGMCNMSMVAHPPPVLFNAGWIEVTQGKFSFYADGCSPSVCKVMEAVDLERMDVAKALGFKQRSFVEILKAWYGESERSSIYDYVHYSMTGHGYFPAPPTLNNRYLTEDMAYVLIPVRNLARRFRISTPMIDSLILTADTLLGQKFEAKRNFELVIKDGQTIQEMNENLSKGM